MSAQLLRSSVLDLLDKCERCSLPGRDVHHCGTVCPESGIEHSSRGGMRDRPVPCQACRRLTMNWSARCGCTVGRLWDSA